MGVADPRDAELVAAVVGGDVDAFTALIRNYRNLCFRFALRYLGNRDDAEDALQEAFVRAFVGWRRAVSLNALADGFIRSL